MKPIATYKRLRCFLRDTDSTLLPAFMVDWQDPEMIRAQHESLVKLCYFLDGILVWEFLVALPFDLRLLRNGRAMHFAPMVYMSCRFMTLSTALAQGIGFSLQSDFDCQAWYTALGVFSYCSLGTASLLIVLRGLAIWQHSLFPSLFMVAVWLVNVAFLIRSLAIGSQSEWNPTTDACVFPKSNSARDSIINLLVTDTVLLCTVLAGLLRMRNSGGLWSKLLSQGIVWITIAIAFGIPGAVFIVLDLNEPMNMMFQTLTLASLTICATRMYRDLSEYASKPIATMDFIGGPFPVFRDTTTEGGTLNTTHSIVLTSIPPHDDPSVVLGDDMESRDQPKTKEGGKGILGTVKSETSNVT